ncbi:MAG: DUF4271 domain-containing protein [Flavobacterium sp.]|jgi:hypothetical protein|nr:DUF4271 domain-containing protein [Flavobacterium sp.]|tara:strand:- start:100 stop:744 length:645 start_codon:yes stop_codon:yes gene_type:complete
MEAVQRDVLSNNWIVLIFIFSIGILFFLKIFNTDKLKGYATSIFNKGFIEIEAEENYFRFSFFHVGFSFFFLLMLTVSIYLTMHQNFQKEAFLFLDYLQVSKYVLLCLTIRYVVDFLLIILFEIRDSLVTYFFFSRRSYSYSISLGLLILNILYFYTFNSYYFLIFGIIALFSIRYLLILYYNKNLIIKELFYFILYLCAFELAPLFVLFKLIF